MNWSYQDLEYEHLVLLLVLTLMLADYRLYFDGMDLERTFIYLEAMTTGSPEYHSLEGQLTEIYIFSESFLCIRCIEILDLLTAKVFDALPRLLPSLSVLIYGNRYSRLW